MSSYTTARSVRISKLEDARCPRSGDEAAKQWRSDEESRWAWGRKRSRPAFLKIARFRGFFRKNVWITLDSRLALPGYHMEAASIPGKTLPAAEGNRVGTKTKAITESIVAIFISLVASPVGLIIILSVASSFLRLSASSLPTVVLVAACCDIIAAVPSRSAPPSDSLGDLYRLNPFPSPPSAPAPKCCG